MTDFAAEEFRAISKKAQETGRYDLELILRVKNFKSLTPLRHKPDQSWESVLRIINEAIKEAKETDDVCAPFEKLCEICGISVPTASVLLAAWDPKRFAIIDEKMFDFFRGKDAYNEIKKIFHIDIDNEKLRNMLEETRKEFDETSRSPWEKIYPQIYPKYLKVLHIIQAMTSLSDLREVEWKIWQQ
jgi:hypothetical protein